MGLMPNRITASFPRILAVAVLAVFSLTACLNAGIGAPPATPSPSPGELRPRAATPTTAPTATPASPQVIFSSGPAAEAAQVESLRPVVQDLAGQSGWKMEERSTLAAGDLEPGWKVVVVVSPGPALQDLTTAAPQTEFVAIGNTEGVDSAPNLALISALPDQQAFLAGFIAAATTPDWRIGTLTRTNQPADLPFAQAFLNGGRFLCGICNPLAPPYPGYPLLVEIGSGTDWQAGLNTLTQKGVQTVCLVPEMQTAEILQAVIAAKMRFVSTDPRAVPEELRSGMIASVNMDLAQALRDAWPRIAAGSPAESNSPTTAVITISNTQPDLLTPGKLRLVNQVRDSLASGAIYPLNVEGK
ncbi:MAG TPA: hypothetical protein VMT46_09170 [Anaerolineaceae bacterium]|nr:hypothetical protein [Anaerolineaceae bacterium]